MKSWTDFESAGIFFVCVATDFISYSLFANKARVIWYREHIWKDLGNVQILRKAVTLHFTQNRVMNGCQKYLANFFNSCGFCLPTAPKYQVEVLLHFYSGNLYRNS